MAAARSQARRAVEWLVPEPERPEPALAHFRRMFGGVSTPVSRARAAYWSGRASADLGLKTEAEKKRDAFYRDTCDELVKVAGDGFVDAVSAEPWLPRLDWTCVGVAKVCSRDWFFNDAHPEMQQAGG